MHSGDKMPVPCGKHVLSCGQIMLQNAEEDALNKDVFLSIDYIPKIILLQISRSSLKDSSRIHCFYRRNCRSYNTHRVSPPFNSYG